MGPGQSILATFIHGYTSSKTDLGGLTHISIPIHESFEADLLGIERAFHPQISAKRVYNASLEVSFNFQSTFQMIYFYIARKRILAKIGVDVPLKFIFIESLSPTFY